MASRRPPYVLRLRREAVYAAIVVLFLFATAEAVLRAQHAMSDARRGERPYSIRTLTHDLRPYDDSDGRIVHTTDPFLIYRPLPSQQTGVVTINGDGFRGAEWRHEKAPGTKRAIVLGGSAAFGMNTSGDAAVFTARLEAKLGERARARGGRVEVWNAGVIGYDSSQELALLATKLVDFAPDAIVCFDGWNDFRGTGMAADRDAALLHAVFAERDDLLAKRMQPACELLRNLDLFRSLESGVQRWMRRHAPRGEFGEYYDHCDVLLPRYERNLRAMARLARAYGATPLIVPQPELFQRRDPPASELELRRKREPEGYGDYSRAIYPRFVATAAAVAAAEKAPFVDGTRAFDQVHDDAFADFVHMHDHGNELLADYLLEPLAQALGLDAGGN